MSTVVVNDLVTQLIDHVWEAAANSDYKCAPFESDARHVELYISNISSTLTSINYFDFFLLCYNHLNNRINQHVKCLEDMKKSSMISQLKLCNHERDHHVHSCIYKTLVSYFNVYKSSINDQSVTGNDNDVLIKLMEFVPYFPCISQLTNILNIFASESDNQPKLVYFAQKLIDLNCHIQAAIVIKQFYIEHYFDSNYFLIQLLYEVNLNFCFG